MPCLCRSRRSCTKWAPSSARARITSTRRYIILNSEIFGLDKQDITMVAMISRYHRHSGPRVDHPNYRDMDTDDRIRVSKLSAILRVADALERTHDQRVHEIIVRRDERRLRLVLPGVTDAAVERSCHGLEGGSLRAGLRP